MTLDASRRRFGPALLRAQRIDAYNRARPELTDTPIAESVLQDYAFADPHVNDYAAEETS